MNEPRWIDLGTETHTFPLRNMTISPALAAVIGVAACPGIGVLEALIRHEEYLLSAAACGLDQRTASEALDDAGGIYERAMEQIICGSLPFLAAAQRARRLQAWEATFDAAVLAAFSRYRFVEGEFHDGTA